MVNIKAGCEDMIHNEHDHYAQFCGPCVDSSVNENISGAQKELLLRHWKWVFIIRQIQKMMKPQQIEKPDGSRSIIAPFISPKRPPALTCAIPACEYCLLGRAKKRSAGVNKRQPVLDKEGLLSRYQYEVGDFVSTDQFFVRTPRRLPNGYGHERRENRFHGGTIYNDAASGLIWVENQVSLGANETVLGKSRFEEWLWEQASADISHYHSDNGVFFCR